MCIVKLSSCAAPSAAVLGRLEGALVEVRGHSDGDGIVHRVDHRAPARLGVEQRLAEVQERL